MQYSKNVMFPSTER